MWMRVATAGLAAKISSTPNSMIANRAISITRSTVCHLVPIFRLRRRGLWPINVVGGFMGLSQLQGRQADQGQDKGDDPETDDNGGLGPAGLLEMVVQRRHAEKALTARRLEIGDLDHDRQGLGDEQAPDDDQN